MSDWREVSNLSNQPDARYLRISGYVQMAALSVAFTITSLVLLGWLVPAFSGLLPDRWGQMKADTALGLMACAIGLSALRGPQKQWNKSVAMACGAAAVVLALFAFYAYMPGLSASIGSWLMAEPAGAWGMSVSTATFMVPAGLTLMAQSGRKRRLARIADILLTLALLQILVLFAGHVYGAISVDPSGTGPLTSLQTLIAMTALTVAMVVRQFGAGSYSLIVGIGLGSSFLRIGLPWIFVVPFLIISFALGGVQRGFMDLHHAAAFAATASIVITLVFSMFVARKLNHLEAELRLMSLNDPLTGIHNRRGFELLADHLWLQAKRNRQQVALLYFDLDGLKRVNDRCGHDIGSQLIVEFADLLQHSHRHSDIVARLGGDEFAVLLRDATPDASLARLQQATLSANSQPDRPYRILYSVGIELASPAEGGTLEDLVNRADEAMYRQKRFNQAAAQSGEPEVAVNRSVG